VIADFSAFDGGNELIIHWIPMLNDLFFYVEALLPRLLGLKLDHSANFYSENNFLMIQYP
jgi:hypothetical protein